MNSNQPSLQNKANILIVDDTLPNLRLLATMLTDQGYKVRGVSSGPAALKAAHLSPPDLILLDIMMPSMDGYEVCRHLKKDERTCDIPIIFISALDEAMDKVRAFSSGGVDYITKPFQLEEVLARVRTHLTLWQLQQQLQHTNAQLLEANETLKIRNEELDAFAHTVAHDLNNPVTSILGYSELLGKEDLSQENSARFLGIISKTAYKMRSIIRELLLLAGVRKAEILPESLDMAEIVAAAQQRLDRMIKEYQAQIDLPPDWPVAVGYAPWIEEVWVNYLSNAMKYGGQPPHLQLGATPPPSKGEAKGGLVQFWVQDNGSGLTPEEQAELFVPFTRLTQLQVEGHGLGLSIVQRIVEKLGGQVGVESTVGQGSKFSFAMPAKRSR